MFKFLVWHVLIGAISCELFNQQLGYSVEYAPKYDNYQPRDYHFDYAVSDPHTGDHKSQWEVKEKGVVRGGYSLLEPDGTTRVVEYIADDDGFRAVVKKLGTAVHPTPLHAPVPVVAAPLPVVSHHGAYDGQVNNYADLAVPQFYKSGNEEPLIARPQALGVIEQDKFEGVPINQHVYQSLVPTIAQSYSNAVIQGQKQNRIEAPLGTIEAVQLGQQHNLGPVPLSYGQNLPRIETTLPEQAFPINQAYSLGRIEAIPFRGQNLGRIEANYGGIEAVPVDPTGYNLGRIEAVPHQGQTLSRIELVPVAQGNFDASLGRIEGVPLDQGHNLGRIEAVPHEGQTSGRTDGEIDANLGRAEAVPYNQGHNVERIEQGQDEVPGLVPVGPSYRTVIEYHGLTGNPEDDSRYSNDEYSGSYSQKVPKVVPSPEKTTSDKNKKSQFLIYYPGKESQ